MSLAFEAEKGVLLKLCSYCEVGDCFEVSECRFLCLFNRSCLSKTFLNTAIAPGLVTSQDSDTLAWITGVRINIKPNYDDYH